MNLKGMKVIVYRLRPFSKRAFVLRDAKYIALTRCLTATCQQAIQFIAFKLEEGLCIPKQKPCLLKMAFLMRLFQ